MQILKLFIAILFLLVTGSSWAQNFEEVMRYEYQLTYKPFKNSDIDSLSESVKELFLLDILDKESRFISSISLQEIEEEIGNKSSNTDDTSFVNWLVFKEGNVLKTIEDFPFLGSYNVSQSVDLVKWKILPEFEEYNGIKVQKAVGALGGRVWIVWFTQDIPLNEGPYKFKNLPGFVVMATDDQADYKFELLNSSKSKTYWTAFKVKKPSKKVTLKQLKKLRHQYENKTLLQIMNETGRISISEDIDLDIFNYKNTNGNNPIELE